MADKFVQLHDGAGNNLYPNTVTVGPKISDKFITVEARSPESGTATFNNAQNPSLTLTIPEGYGLLSIGQLQTNGFVGSGYVLTPPHMQTGNVSLGAWMYLPGGSGTGYITAQCLCVKIEDTSPIVQIPRLMVPITNGGTGADNAIGALANLGIFDYVVERGTNYMKYASGLMIQWGTHTPGSIAMSAMGNIYVSSWITITYPQPFVTFLGGSLCKLDASANTGIYNVSWQTTNVQYTAFRADTNYSGTHSASWVAFGTWK